MRLQKEFSILGALNSTDLTHLSHWLACISYVAWLVAALKL